MQCDPTNPSFDEKNVGIHQCEIPWGDSEKEGVGRKLECNVHIFVIARKCLVSEQADVNLGPDSVALEGVPCRRQYHRVRHQLLPHSKRSSVRGIGLRGQSNQEYQQ